TYGADWRVRSLTLAEGPLNMCMDCPEPGKYCICDDRGVDVLATIAERATQMTAHSLAMTQLPRARTLAVNPIDTDRIPYGPAPRERGTLRIGHFPNHGHFKGTRYLEEAVARLKSEGRPIELVMISGRPRIEIVEAMRSVDVVVDQLISGA